MTGRDNGGRGVVEGQGIFYPVYGQRFIVKPSKWSLRLNFGPPIDSGDDDSCEQSVRLTDEPDKPGYAKDSADVKPNVPISAEEVARGYFC